MSSSRIRETSDPASLAFERVYEDHFAFVWRTARRLGVGEEALDDVAQEVFVVVHRRLPEFEGRSSLKTWLYHIVTNTARNHRRHEQRKAPHLRGFAGPDPDETPGRLLGPEAALGQSQAVDLAREILMQMSEAKRMAFVLVELEGMSLADVAESLEENVHTVRARLRAAREEFERHARRLQNFAQGGAHG